MITLSSKDLLAMTSYAWILNSKINAKSKLKQIHTTTTETQLAEEKEWASRTDKISKQTLIPTKADSGHLVAACCAIAVSNWVGV